MHILVSCSRLRLCLVERCNTNSCVSRLIKRENVEARICRVGQTHGGWVSHRENKHILKGCKRKITNQACNLYDDYVYGKELLVSSKASPFLNQQIPKHRVKIQHVVDDLKNIPRRQELKPQLVKCSARVFPNCFCQFATAFASDTGQTIAVSVVKFTLADDTCGCRFT